MELLLFADNMILYTEIPKDATETTRNNKQIKLQDKKKQCTSIYCVPIY